MYCLSPQHMYTHKIYTPQHMLVLHNIYPQQHIRCCPQHVSELIQVQHIKCFPQDIFYVHMTRDLQVMERSTFSLVGRISLTPRHPLTTPHPLTLIPDQEQKQTDVERPPVVFRCWYRGIWVFIFKTDKSDQNQNTTSKYSSPIGMGQLQLYSFAGWPSL